LAELDADGDGKITAADTAFAELVRSFPCKITEVVCS